MMGLFEACADAGDSIVKFVRRGKGEAVVVGILCFVTPVNIIMWLLMLCAIYRKGK